MSQPSIVRPSSAHPSNSAPSLWRAEPLGWAVSSGLTDYAAALTAMEARAAAIREGAAGELIWLLEHPPLYTAGVSAKDADLLQPDRFPVHRVGRGGQFTYHGPGQRVAYVMLDLRERGRDVRAFVRALEDWIIAALARFGVAAHTDAERVGVWTPRPGAAGCADKIAAIGVRLTRWVSYHGVAVNVAPDVSHFSGITPCGVSDARYGVTSLAALGVAADMATFDAALAAEAAKRFGRVTDCDTPLALTAGA